MNRDWIRAGLFSDSHINGVEEFMKFVRERFNENQDIRCPCRDCLNRSVRPQWRVMDHLIMAGMSVTYDRWIYHGEAPDAEIHHGFEPNEVVGEGAEENNNDLNQDGDEADRIPEMVQELYREEEAVARDSEPAVGGESSFLSGLIQEMKRELHPGCAKYSRLSFIVKLLHIKSYHRISNVGFTAMLKVLSDAYPISQLPKSYVEAKKFIRALGLGYESIPVCKNNCVLFRGQYAKYDECPIYHASRWKDAERKKVPEKILRYFPLIPRMRRMLQSKHTAEDAQWHKLKRKPKEKELSHPADGEAWK